MVSFVIFELMVRICLMQWLELSIVRFSSLLEWLYHPSSVSEWSMGIKRFKLSCFFFFLSFLNHFNILLGISYPIFTSNPNPYPVHILLDPCLGAVSMQTYIT